MNVGTSFSPKLGCQKDDDGIDFESAQKHAPDEKPLAHSRNDGIIFRRAHHTETRADITDAGGYGGQGCHEIDTEA